MFQKIVASKGRPIIKEKGYLHLSLFQAIHDENASRLKELLDAGADPDCHDHHGYTPFSKAIRKRNPALAIILIDLMDIKKATEDGKTPLFLAKHFGREDVVILIEIKSKSR